jgi:hypothetical protein
MLAYQSRPSIKIYQVSPHAKMLPIAMPQTIPMIAVSQPTVSAKYQTLILGSNVLLLHKFLRADDKKQEQLSRCSSVSIEAEIV